MRGKPWKSGQSGNPHGRPKKGETLTELMNQLLDKEKVNVESKNGRKKKISAREAIVRSVIQLAIKGDQAAQKLVWSYSDGMPREKISMEIESTPSELAVAMREASERNKNNNSGSDHAD